MVSENAPILETKLETYSPDTIVCGLTDENDFNSVWSSIEKAYGGIKSYTTKHFDKLGNKMPSGEDSGLTAYYCETNSGRQIIVLHAYHFSANRYGWITPDGWSKGIVNAVNCSCHASSIA